MRKAHRANLVPYELARNQAALPEMLKKQEAQVP